MYINDNVYYIKPTKPFLSLYSKPKKSGKGTITQKQIEENKLVYKTTLTKNPYAKSGHQLSNYNIGYADSVKKYGY